MKTNRQLKSCYFENRYLIIIILIFMMFSFVLMGCDLVTRPTQKVDSKSDSTSLQLEVAEEKSIPNMESREVLIIFGNQARLPKIGIQDGEPKGILVDILNTIETDLGVDFDLSLLPMARSILCSTEKQGGIVGFSKTTERLKDFEYSNPIYYDEVILVVKKGEEFKFEKLEDLRGKNIGVQRSASYGPKYEEAKEIFTLIETDSLVSSLLLLDSGRIDAIVVSPGIAGLNTILKDPQLASIKNNFVQLNKVLDNDANYLAFHKDMGMTEFLTRFNQALKKENDAGEIQRIIDRY